MLGSCAYGPVLPFSSMCHSQMSHGYNVTSYNKTTL